MFDSLHTGDRCGQVKCLGKQLGDITPGDVATLHRIATPNELARMGEPPDVGVDATQEEFDAWVEHPFTVGVLVGVPRSERSWQILMSDGSYALFTNGRFVGFVSDGPHVGVVTVDNLGRDVAVGVVADQLRTGFAYPPGDCEVCAVVRDAASLVTQLEHSQGPDDTPS